MSNNNTVRNVSRDRITRWHPRAPNSNVKNKTWKSRPNRHEPGQTQSVFQCSYLEQNILTSPDAKNLQKISRKLIHGLCDASKRSATRWGRPHIMSSCERRQHIFDWL